MKIKFCLGALTCLVGIAAVAPVMGAPMKDESQSRNTTPTEIMAKPADDVPDDLRWEPWWRERGDCGPLALFVLMQLQNKQVTLDEIKKLVRVDPEEGCSLKDLQAAAEQLGMPTEARFVEPRDLCRVPGPFISHGLWSVEKNRGHFFLVFGYDAADKKYATIDTTLAKLGWIPEDTVLRGYSGYVLVPKEQISQKWGCWTGYSLLLIGGTILSLWSYSMFRRRKGIET